MGAYYTNGLKATRTELLRKLRQEMARYGRLERAMAPRQDQGKTIDFLKKQIALVDAALDDENTNLLIEQTT